MFRITLDSENRSFVPGDRISGRVEWKNLKGAPEKVEIRLIWHTTGKGDQDCEFVDSVEHSQPKSNGESGFDFVAPSRPFSFSGKLISLTWAIEALVFPSLDAEQAELVISSDGKEVILHA